MNWNSLPGAPFLEHFRISKNQFKRLNHPERLSRIRQARQASPDSEFLEQLEGDTLFRIGERSWQFKDTERAWEYLDRAATIFRKFGWDDPSSIKCLWILYLANSKFNRGTAATDCHREFNDLLNRTIRQATTSEASRQNLMYLARSFFYDAVRLSKKEEYSASLDSLIRCRELCEKLNWEKKTAQTYRQEIIIRNNQEEFEKAQAAYQIARILYEEIGDPLEIARTDWLASRTFYCLGKSDRRQYERSLELHYRALGPLEAGGYDTYWNHYQIGLNLLGLNRKQAAINEFEKSIGRLEQRRGELRALAFRRNLQEDTIKIYQTAVDICCEIGDAPRAFSFLERSRSMTFLDLLENSALFQKPRSVDSPNTRRRKEVKEKFLALEKELSDQEDAFALGSKKAEDLRRELEILSREYSSLPIKADYEQYPYEELESPAPVTLEEVRRWLDDGQVIVEYSAGRFRTRAFIIDRTSIQAIDLGISAKQLDDATGGFLKEIDLLSRQEGGHSDAALAGTYAMRRREMHRALIAPIWDHLEGKRHVVIVPDGSLFQVPFHLLGMNGDCLLDRFAVSYLPLLGILKYRHKPRLSKESIAGMSALLIDNPLRDLDHIEDEIERIRKIMLPGKTEIWPPEMATADRFLAHAGDHQIVHFAGHSVFRPDRPFFSHLKLADDAGREVAIDVDGIIEKLRLRETLLLVLSSCSSGRVDVGKSREVLGLIRGLIFAGAPSLILTLWDIADRSAGDLMAEFYRRLVDSGDPSESLRQAQLSMRAKNPSPQLWGSFVHYGI